MADTPSMTPAVMMTAAPWSLALSRVLADGDSLLVATSARCVDALRCRLVARPYEGSHQGGWSPHKTIVQMFGFLREPSARICALDIESRSQNALVSLRPAGWKTVASERHGLATLTIRERGFPLGCVERVACPAI